MLKYLRWEAKGETREISKQFMFNLVKFISDSGTFRPVSIFAPDIEVNGERVTGKIWGKMVCVIGGGAAGPTSSKRSAIRNDECDC